MSDEWTVRIGPEATAIRRKARSCLAGTIFIFLGYLALSTFVGLLVTPGSNIRELVALSDLVIASPFLLVGMMWSSRILGHACRAGAIFVQLERHTGEPALPRASLRNTTMFDNLMIRRNVGSGGRYKPHPSESWVNNTDGRFGTGRF